jgi:hypothetical protein
MAETNRGHRTTAEANRAHQTTAEADQEYRKEVRLCRMRAEMRRRKAEGII